MARSGRLVWTKSVLQVIPIYTMMADSLPPWARKEIDAICKKFLWVGKDAAVRGKCMVAGDTCCRSTELGGLGIPNLKLQGYALQTKWLWLQKTDNSRAWSQLPLRAEPEVLAFFRASTGDGNTSLFWEDRWLNGADVAELAPNLVKQVPGAIRRRLSVRQGLSNRDWTRFITGALTDMLIAEFFDL
jgi:hypothetical protein